MKHKTIISLILALFASLLVGGAALAQAEVSDDVALPRPGRGGRRAVGQVLALGESQFTLGTRAGKEQTILVGENTRFIDQSGAPQSFEDLQIEDWVAVVARVSSEGDIVARLVILLPEDYDPSQRLGQHARGHISSVDNAAATFTVHTLRGEEVTFATNANTVFRGEVESLDDLQMDMQVGVAGLVQSDGSLLALALVAGGPDARHAGAIVSIDIPADRFVLLGLNGEQYTYHVTEATRYFSWRGEIQNLEDLRVGMWAVVTAAEVDGALEARMVRVGPVRR